MMLFALRNVQGVHDFNALEEMIGEDVEFGGSSEEFEFANGGSQGSETQMAVQEFIDEEEAALDELKSKLGGGEAGEWTHNPFGKDACKNPFWFKPLWCHGRRRMTGGEAVQEFIDEEEEALNELKMKLNEGETGEWSNPFGKDACKNNFWIKPLWCHGRRRMTGGEAVQEFIDEEEEALNELKMKLNEGETGEWTHNPFGKDACKNNWFFKPLWCHGRRRMSDGEFEVQKFIEEEEEALEDLKMKLNGEETGEWTHNPFGKDACKNNWFFKPLWCHGRRMD